MELHKIEADGVATYVLLDSRMQLIQPVNRYLEYLRLRGRTENTIKAYAYDLKVFFAFLESRGVSFEGVDTSVIREYVEYLRRNYDNVIEIFNKSARSPGTMNRMLGTITGFYSYLSSFEDTCSPIPLTVPSNKPVVFKDIMYHTKRSNCTKSSIFKVKESDYKVHLLKPDEIQRMYSELPTYRDKLLFKFLLQSGARIGEALSLKIHDVPVPDPTEPVTILKGIKSKGKYRDIYIPSELAVELDEYILENRVHIDTDHEYLFTTQHPYYGNKQITYRGIYEVFKRAAAKAGIEFRFHDIRHTYVTELIESGMDISVVRILAGHAHISTTQKYVTLSSEFISKSLDIYWKSVAPEGADKNE